MTNTLVIFVDDMRYDHVQFMQHVEERFAAGTRFTDCRPSTPLCQPSRVAFLTGQYAFRTGVFLNTDAFANGSFADTIGVWLDNAGVYCGAMGKWPLGTAGTARAEWSYRRTFRNNEQDAYDFDVYDNSSTSAPIMEFQTDYLAARFDDFLAAATEPWFMWLTPTNPHIGTNPTVGQPRWSDVFSYPRLQWDVDYLVELADDSTWPSWIQALGPLSDSKKDLIRTGARKMAQELVSLDALVEHCFDALAGAGQLATTNVIFTSDNAVFLGEQQVFGISPAAKNMPYDGPGRVPLLAVGPDFPQGTNAVPTILQDVTATLIDTYSATPTLQQDGTSLIDIAANPAAYDDRACLFEREGNGTTTNGVPNPVNSQGVNCRIDGIRWKFMRYAAADPDQYELTDMTNDPGEQVNQAYAGGAYLTARNACEALTDALLAS